MDDLSKATIADLSLIQKIVGETPVVEEVEWGGDVPEKDDYGYTITDRFVDGKTKQGYWAIMTPGNFRSYGINKFGKGLGQMYKRTKGKWIKIKG